MVIYDFDHVGDMLDMHNHKHGGAHITIVAKGSFKARGNGWEIDLQLGNVTDWQADQWHEFEALENGSRLVNVIK